METRDAVVPRALPPVPRAGSAQETRQAAAQEFVARLRAGAPGFAAAAGAASAVVPEVVPPARHRRARCRTVLRYADGAQADLTFLGPAGPPTLAQREGFADAIRRWLAAGRREADEGVAAAPAGVPVDLCVWAAAAD